jgi:transposase
MSTRKTYTKEFKLDAVSLVLEQDYTKAEAFRSLSINPNMLARWIKELDTEDEHAFRGNGKLSPEQEQIKELHRRVKHLEMEKDILKKATVFFAAKTK